jgi:hypothetical protein
MRTSFSIRRLSIVLCAVAGLMLAGCKHDQIHIQSNTAWSGTVNNSINFSGRGDATYEMHGKLSCVQVTKALPDTLYLRVRINDNRWEETTQPGGTIFECK